MNKSPYVYADGSKEWIFKSNLYNLNGPAIVFPSGVKVWYAGNSGYLGQHRNGGPARINPMGIKEFSFDTCDIQRIMNIL